MLRLVDCIQIRLKPNTNRIDKEKDGSRRSIFTQIPADEEYSNEKERCKLSFIERRAHTTVFKRGEQMDSIEKNYDRLVKWQCEIQSLTELDVMVITSGYSLFFYFLFLIRLFHSSGDCVEMLKVQFKIE